MPVTYTFGSATSAIPLSQLDTNFATPITLGNAAIQLGNTVTTLGNVTIAGSTLSSVNIAGGSANGVVYLNSSNVATANASVFVFDGTNLGLGVTPSAWGTGYNKNTLQIGSYASIGTNNYGNGYSIFYHNYYQNNTNSYYLNNGYASNYLQSNGFHQWNVASSGTAGNVVTFNTAMTLSNSGNLNVTQTSGASGYPLTVVAGGGGDGTGLAIIENSSGVGNHYLFTGAGTGVGTSGACYWMYKNSSTSRSLNCAGTVNQNGADYAEYMTKSGNFTINKGDICGVDVNGKLTNVFANAISFVVKSTDPGIVGGDKWGTEEALGLTYPQQPKPPVRSQNESDADWATAEANYQIAVATYNTQLTAYNTALEAARQMVDRIAFSGQVPVNVTGATAGQYIVPVAKQDGSIGGEAVSESAMTLQQYMQSVGKVISVVGNVTTIIVKVA